MKIKLCPADIVFSQYIRLRDKRCVRCGKPVKFNAEGLPISHEASHYFGRGNESTRFDPENVDTLCKLSCHEIWSSKDREEYRKFKIKQLGEIEFNALILRSHLTQKKDREMALIVARVWLREELKKAGIVG